MFIYPTLGILIATWQHLDDATLGRNLSRSYKSFRSNLEVAMSYSHQRQPPSSAQLNVLMLPEEPWSSG